MHSKLTTVALRIASLIVGGAILVTVAPFDSASSRSARYGFAADAAPSGIRLFATRTWGQTFVDYNRDGWTDLLVGRHLRRPIFFRNRSGSFARVGRDRMPALGYPPAGRDYYDRHSCAWGEANGDGRPDLYCVSGAQKGEGTGPNQLLLQTSSGILEDHSAGFGVMDLKGRGRSLNWLDYDLDGRLDIFVGNERRAGEPNVLFHNEGSSFQKVDAGLSASISTRSSSWADWNNDGYPDLAVLTEKGSGAVAYQNEGGRFRPVSIPYVSGRWWSAATWGDFDGDGWVDVALTARDELLVLRNEQGRFEAEYHLNLRQGRMAAWLDVENDGDLDLYVVQGSSANKSVGNVRDFLVLREGDEFARLDVSGRFELDSGNGDSASVADFDRDGRVDVAITNGYSEGPKRMQLRGRVELLRNTSTAGHWVGVALDGGPTNPYGFGARVLVQTDDFQYWRQLTDGVAFKSQSDAGTVHLGVGPAEKAEIKVVWADGSSDCIVALADRSVPLSKGTAPCLAEKTEISAEYGNLHVERPRRLRDR